MKIHFKKNKYGQDLAIDCGVMSETRLFVRDSRPFFVTFYEILFITRGKGAFRLDDERMDFSPGTVLLLPRDKWRQWTRIDEAIDGYFLIFEEEFITTFFNDALFLSRFHYFYNKMAPSFIHTPEAVFMEMIAKLKEIRAEISGLRNDSHHLLRAILYYLLIRINRIYEAQFNLRDKLFQDTLTLKFRKLLEENIRTAQKVSEYAGMLGVSRSHLNKTLNRAFGKPCSDIIRERLLAEIKKELLYSDRTIGEIAYAFNFSEPGNFIRFFKSMAGATPKEFRRANSN